MWDQSFLFFDYNSKAFIGITFQGKNLWVAEHIRIYKGNGRDVYRTSERKYVCGNCTSNHNNKYL